mmetsp:Transcript_19377/g.51729  ORF Transcript_19377/g.51729 Transcript_19377/m.51729 type:complete len:103 (+) Transcript_19377:1896-2204(+)
MDFLMLPTRVFCGVLNLSREDTCAVSREKFVSVVNWQSGVLPGAVGRFCAEGQRFCLGPSGALCSHTHFWKCHSVTLSKYLYRGLFAIRSSSPTVVATLLVV